MILFLKFLKQFVYNTIPIRSFCEYNEIEIYISTRSALRMKKECTSNKPTQTLINLPNH